MKLITVATMLGLAGALLSSVGAHAQEVPKDPPRAISIESKELTQKNLDAIFGKDKYISFVAARSSVGDTASGVVVTRTAYAIEIDVTPCLAKKTIVTFLAPFKESSISDEKCDDKTYPRVQVIQLGSTFR